MEIGVLSRHDGLLNHILIFSSPVGMQGRESSLNDLLKKKLACTGAFTDRFLSNLVRR